jgi:hypothetical protein
MAIFAWLTIEQAEEYVEAANREKLASDAIGPAGETISERNSPTKTRVGPPTCSAIWKPRNLHGLGTGNAAAVGSQDGSDRSPISRPATLPRHTAWQLRSRHQQSIEERAADSKWERGGYGACHRALRDACSQRGKAGCVRLRLPSRPETPGRLIRGAYDAGGIGRAPRSRRVPAESKVNGAFTGRIADPLPVAWHFNELSGAQATQWRGCAAHCTCSTRRSGMRP